MRVPQGFPASRTGYPRESEVDPKGKEFVGAAKPISSSLAQGIWAAVKAS
jgi:hypothetical protein